MKKEEMICTCEIGVAASELNTRELLELIDEFESAGIEVVNREKGLYNGDEDWELKGPLEVLEKTLTSLGWDVSTIEFEDFYN